MDSFTPNGASEELPLHALQPLARFSDRAEDYANYRPSYPPEAIAWIVAELASEVSWAAADIGAGTGISARLLADAGGRVWAIEPNRAMQQAATPHPAVTPVSGTAEHTTLPDASVDLVTCFQAFHWFNPAQCLPEFRRILRPSGRLAVVWNTRDLTDPFTAGYSEIVRELSGQHPAESRMDSIQPLQASREFRNLCQHTIPYGQSLDLSGLMGRAQSVSYIPKDDSTQQQLLAHLTALYQQYAQPDLLATPAEHQPAVTLRYQTQVFLADPQ
jgi:SAM-dependent methyltransferase